MLRIVIVALALFFFAAHSSFACMCDYKSTEQNYLNADYVFTGKVKSSKRLIREENCYSAIVTFEVIQQWKNPISKEVKMNTSGGCGECTIPFTNGEEYLVYSKKTSDDNSSMSLIQCGGTEEFYNLEPKQLSEIARASLKLEREKKLDLLNHLTIATVSNTYLSCAGIPSTIQTQCYKDKGN